MYLKRDSAPKLTIIIIIALQEVEKIRLEKEKLVDLEHQLHAVKGLTLRSTNADDAEALKKRCSEMQDAVENHRFLVDNLEFQQLEVSTLDCMTLLFSVFCIFVIAERFNRYLLTFSNDIVTWYISAGRVFDSTS